MDERERRVRDGGARDERRHDLVHVRRTERAPDRHDQRLVRVEPELALGLRLGAGRERAAHRRAGDDDLFLLAVVLLALLEADEDAVDRAGEHLRRQAGHGVGLMHDGRDAELRRRLEHGVADVAAGADGDVGLKVLDDLARVLRRLPRIVQRAEVIRDLRWLEAAVDVRDLHGHDVVARTRDEVGLHLAVGADEEDAAVGHPVAQDARDRERGVDVACGAAAGKEKVHSNASQDQKNGNRAVRAEGRRGLPDMLYKIRC